MKLKDFISGKTVIELENGRRYLFLNNKFMNKDRWFDLGCIKDNLTTDLSKSGKKIMKVYNTNGYCLESLLDDAWLELVWERKEYITFNEARKSDRRFKHKNMHDFDELGNIMRKLVNIYSIDDVNRMLDSKLWEVEQ